MIRFIENIDVSILEFIGNFLHFPILDPLFLFLTTIGNGGIIWSIIAVFLIARKQTRETGIFVLLALLLSVVCVEIILKPLFGRLRPFQSYDAFKTILAGTKGFSFPSGHTTTSFAALGVLFGRTGNSKWGFVILAIGIAFSRLYFNLHYPSDILGGIILGLVCATIVTRYKFKKLKL